MPRSVSVVDSITSPKRIPALRCSKSKSKSIGQTTGSLTLGALLTIPLMSRHRGVAGLATVYVDTMRCVPFLLFVYLIYFGLPSAGLSPSAFV